MEYSLNFELGNLNHRLYVAYKTIRLLSLLFSFWRKRRTILLHYELTISCVCLQDATSATACKRVRNPNTFLKYNIATET